MKKVAIMAGIGLLMSMGVQAELMSFSTDFDSYSVGALHNSADWTNGPWSGRFSVEDSGGGDMVAAHSGNANYSICPVDPTKFTLDAGQDLVLTNKFTGTIDGFTRGVVLNYTQKAADVYDMYTVYLTRDAVNAVILKIDKWVDSSGIGSVIQNIFLSEGFAARQDWSSGEMVVTYDASESRIGVTVNLANDKSISTSVVDTSFNTGMVGLYGRSATNYKVTEFSVAAIPESSTPGVPLILKFSMGESGLDFEWRSLSGKLYDLESTTSLVAPDWQGVSGFTNMTPSGTGLNALDDVGLDGQLQFFRVIEK